MTTPEAAVVATVNLLAQADRHPTARAAEQRLARSARACGAIAWHCDDDGLAA